MANNFLTAVLQDVLSFLQDKDNFFNLDLPEKQEVLKETSFSSDVKRYLEKSSAASFSQDIQELNAELLLESGSAFIIVETPVPLTAQQKSTIKEGLSEKHPSGVPMFSVNKNLVGGLRIFVNGKMHDYSWLSMINKLTSIKPTK